MGIKNGLAVAALTIPAVAVALSGLMGCSSTDEGSEPAAQLGASAQALTCVNLGAAATDDAVLAYDPIDATKAGANFSTAQVLNVGTTGTTVRQALVRFNLASVPASATITSASLQLTKAASLGAGPMTLHRATATWVEATVTYNSFAGAFDSTVLGSVNPAVSGSSLAFDVTGQVASWFSGAQPNHGFLLAEPSNGRISVGASEAPSSATRPTLTVCYAPSTCANGVLDGTETGVDCGGSCAPCVDLCASVTCTALDACHVPGVCNPSTGVCSNPVASWGTACDDGDACSQTDVCQNGACVGTNPVLCSALDACHVAGSCDPASGVCSTPAAADGSACDDGDGCTLSDVCQSGLCAGSSGAGAFCSTGLPGVCAAGTTACTNGSLSCVQNQQMGSESCGNALDDDCDGQADEGCGASCPAGFITVAGGCQTTYFIDAPDLDNLGGNCGGSGVDFYNGCGSAPYGFHWTDLGAGLGPVSHVSVDFRQGVSCSSAPQQASTSLNGVGTGSITASAGQCTCTPGAYNDASIPSLPQGALSVYVAGGVNSFSIAPTTNCEGLSRNTLWSSAFAIVTVTYGSLACDPNAAEVCNGYDDNCDGVADEGVTTTFYVDADGDGYGSPAATTQACSTPPGYAPTSADCDDAASSTHPGAGESCDGVDQNCDGQVDEGNPSGGSQCATGIPGQCASGLTVCTGGAVVCAPKYPAVAEACLDGLDNDCNGLADDGCDGGVCPAGFNAVNGTCQILYLIDGSALQNLGSNCSGSGVNLYNGCSSAAYGFTWTDVDPQMGPLSGIDVELNEGVSCLSSPTQTGADLNGVQIGSFQSHANQCTCTPVTDVASISLLSGTANSAYHPGASNTFSIATLTNCAGALAEPDVGRGLRARARDVGRRGLRSERR
jgi:hypothetical protein